MLNMSTINMYKRYIKNKTISRIKMLAPWWHDIYFPDLNISTQKLTGIDVRLLQAYEVKGFPNGYFKKSPLKNITNKKVLEIGPASGFYTVKLAQQNNNVTCIEREGKFIEQLKFLRTHFNLEDRISIYQGEFPSVIPSGRYDVVSCLGVLYHIKDYCTFLSTLDSISAIDVYLETLISKTGYTEKAGTNEGYAFSEDDIANCILKNMPNYMLVERINFNDSKNIEYNKLSYYRCLLCLRKI